MAVESIWIERERKDGKKMRGTEERTRKGGEREGGEEWSGTGWEGNGKKKEREKVIMNVVSNQGVDFFLLCKTQNIEVFRLNDWMWGLHLSMYVQHTIDGKAGIQYLSVDSLAPSCAQSTFHGYLSM